MIGYQTRILSITEGCTVWGVNKSPETGLGQNWRQLNRFLHSLHFTLLEPEELFSVDFRLMTGCRLMSTQVNGTKVQHQIRTRDPAGFVGKKPKETGLLKYKAVCLKTKGTQISTVKSCSLLFCSGDFEMVCMTERTVRRPPPNPFDTL